jgi:hypothetical protein
MTQQNSRDDVFTINSTANVTLAPEVNKGSKRSQFIICNTSTTQKITIVKKALNAVAGSGIVLNPSGSYGESTDSGFKCYQGAINSIADVDGATATITESFEDQ